MVAERLVWQEQAHRKRPAGWRASGLRSDFGLSFIPQHGKVGIVRNALGTTSRSLRHGLCSVRFCSVDRHLGRHKEPDSSR